MGVVRKSWYNLHMIYHKIELKNADSLRLHYPISYRRKLSTPVQITVEDNEVHMLAHLEFSPKLLKRYVNREPKKGEEASKDLQLEAKGEDFTFADAVCEGIERNWTGSFVFPWLKNGLNGRFNSVSSAASNGSAGVKCPSRPCTLCNGICQMRKNPKMWSMR